MDRKIKYNLITSFLILIEFRFEASFQQLHIFLILVIASFPILHSALESSLFKKL